MGVNTDKEIVAVATDFFDTVKAISTEMLGNSTPEGMLIGDVLDRETIGDPDALGSQDEPTEAERL